MSSKIIKSASQLRDLLLSARCDGRRVGFVPTMGALHSGHVSLIELAKKQCDIVVVSIFVNELQFDDAGDFNRYPKGIPDDLAVASRAGADYVFSPDSKEIYPLPQTVFVSMEGPLTASLEGACRPGYLGGMATIVTKLLWIIGDCRAYFGEKDFQQLLVVQQLACELSQGVEIVACPIAREPDGLAQSSRNRRLEGRARSAATVLHKALVEGSRLISEGETRASEVESAMAAIIEKEPLATLDYAVVANPKDLTRPAEIIGEVRLLVAVSVEGVRLIDNLSAAARKYFDGENDVTIN